MIIIIIKINHTNQSFPPHKIKNLNFHFKTQPKGQNRQFTHTYLMIPLQVVICSKQYLFLQLFLSLLCSPMAELECPKVMNKLLAYLSSLLQRVAESNDDNPRFHMQKISAFHGLTRPTISIQSYLERIFKYANCSPSCYVVAYVYLERFTQQQPALSINSFNVHRLLITSVMIAAKFMDDM